MNCGGSCLHGRCINVFLDKTCPGCSCTSRRESKECKGIHEVASSRFDLTQSLISCERKYPGNRGDGLTETFNISYRKEPIDGDLSIDMFKDPAFFTWFTIGSVYFDHSAQKEETKKPYKWCIVGDMRGRCKTKEAAFEEAKAAFLPWSEKHPEFFERYVSPPALAHDLDSCKAAEPAQEPAAGLEEEEREECDPANEISAATLLGDIDRANRLIEATQGARPGNAQASSAETHSGAHRSFQPDPSKGTVAATKEEIEAARAARKLIDDLRTGKPANSGIFQPFEGVIHAKGAISEAFQLEIIDALRLLRPHWETPQTSKGIPLNLRSASFGLWWKPGREYGPARLSFPPCLDTVWLRAQAIAKIEDYPDWTLEPTTAVVNFYRHDSTLQMHQDDRAFKSFESGRPIVMLSLGEAANMKIGGFEKRDNTIDLRVESGDIVILIGEARKRFHSISQIFPGTSPIELKTPCRISVTMREVF